MNHGRAAVVLFVKRSLDFEPRILAVTNRHYGGIALPGGKADEGENIRCTAVREVCEETSIVLVGRDLTLLAKADSVRPESIREVHLFFARYAWGTPKNVEQGTMYEWVTFSELLDVSPFKDFYARWLPDGVHHLRATVFSDATLAPEHDDHDAL